MIRVRGIRKTFWSNRREVTAIADASIDVGENEFVVLLGPSGSGKTTLLRCVAGLETANEGEIAIGNEVVFASSQNKNVPAEKRRIGMIFQSYAIWPHLTVAENVALPLTHGRMRIDKSLVKERVAQALQAVRLSGLEDRPAPFLSGGQQQRVALARAIAVDPQALLMDEPLSNLDARLREEIRIEIREVAKKSGIPVLYVTHDQTEAMDLADRIVVMDKGRVLQIDTPEALYDRPKTAAVASFLGSMNWLKGRALDDNRVETPLGTLIASHAYCGKAVQVGIRPEKIDLSFLPVDAKNSFRGRCIGFSFLGDHRLYRIQVGSASVVAKRSSKLSQDCIGKDIYLTLPTSAVLVFPDTAEHISAGRMDGVDG